MNIASGREGRNEFLLAELRCAALRARLWQLEIDTIGIALKGTLITPDQAVGLLADRGVLHFVDAEPGSIEV